MPFTSKFPFFTRKQPRIAKSVIGHDDRQFAENYEDKLWRPICALYINYPGESATRLGSGVLIAPRLILTAAHNLYDLERKKTIKDGEVKVGLSASGSQASSQITDIRIPKAYTLQHPSKTRKYDYDYGLALLKDDAVHDWAGHVWPLVDINPMLSRALIASNLTVAGYPAKSDAGYTALKWSFGPVMQDGVQNNTFAYKMDTSGGQSGAPVFQYNSRTGHAALAGIHVAGFPSQHNLANRFSAGVKQNLTKWAADLTRKSARTPMV